MRVEVNISRKGLTINRLPGQTNSFTLLPRTLFNYEKEVNGYQSAIIMACVGWIQRTFPEAPLMLEKRDTKGSWERDYDHPLLTRMDKPNDFYDGLLLQVGAITDFVLSGNAYIRKLRSAAGRVVEYWWLPSTLIEPKWPHDGSQFISHYDYYSGVNIEHLPVEDIIHFRDGFDPRNLRKGLSRLQALFREVFTDDEAANMTAALLKNLGVPGLLVAPKEGVSVSQGDAQATKEWFKEQTTGDKRGEPIVMSGATEVTQFGFNPQQMLLKELRRIPEERISAVIGVPAIVAGLGAGLDRSTYSNFAEAREAAYESLIIPMQRIIGSVIKHQALIDFEDNLETWRVGYDTSQVRILQEDENKKADRIKGLVNDGLMKVIDGQRMLGAPVDDTQNFYLRLYTRVPVRSGDQGIVTDLIPDNAAPAGSEKQLKAYKLTEEGKEAHWLDYALKAESAERAFIDGLKQMFTAQSREAIKSLKAGERETFIDQQGAIQSYKEIATPVLSRLMAEAMRDAAEMVAGQKAAFDWEEYLDANPEALRWLKTRIGWAAEQMSEETAHLLSMKLAEGFAEGESMPQLSKRVKEVFTFCSDTRAMRIARTETIAASNQGALETYQKEGVSKTEFYPAPGACTDCLALTGEYPIKESVGMIPVHPNCRCTWLPVVE